MKLWLMTASLFMKKFIVEGNLLACLETRYGTKGLHVRPAIPTALENAAEHLSRAPKWLAYCTHFRQDKPRIWPWLFPLAL
jgi:hypothetical protein